MTFLFLLTGFAIGYSVANDFNKKETWAADYQINKLNNTIKDLKTQLAMAKKVNETGLLSLPGPISDLIPND
jgi:hypothetical protein